MSTIHLKLFASFLIAGSLFVSACSTTEIKGKPAPLIIREQGSFAVGGTVINNPGIFDPDNPTPEGQTFHGDHAYVFYQIPVAARELPLIFWHGFRTVFEDVGDHPGWA
jgi:hypothetical protein